MKTKEEAIKVIKETMKEYESINLGIGEVGSASWGNKKMDELSPLDWKAVSRVSTLSWAFGIAPEDLKGGDLIMAKENNVEQNKEVEVEKVELKELVPPVEFGPMNTVKGFAMPIKTRALARVKHLESKTLSGWTTNKYLQNNMPVYEDIPPQFHLFKIGLELKGGEGVISYHVRMRHPKTGNTVKSPSGGPIEFCTVTERFVQGKGMTQEINEIPGVPSLSEAIANWDASIQKEKDDISKTRGG